MKKVMVLLKAMLILLFLTSCASYGTTVPKAFIGSDAVSYTHLTLPTICSDEPF